MLCVTAQLTVRSAQLPTVSLCLGVRPRHCSPSLQAQSAREAEVAAEVAEATAAVMAEKDRRLEEAAAASAEASANAAAAAEAAASKLADSERCLAESRATTEFLETEVCI